MITVKDVRDAVIATLDGSFPSCRIYGEEISQGFQEPCFFVKMFPVAQEQELGRRYMRHHSFDIHYFSDAEDKNDDMHDMAEQLYRTMEYLEIKNELCKGTKMKHEIIDGVLHFFVDYDFHVMKIQDETKMEKLQFGGVASE